MNMRHFLAASLAFAPLPASADISFAGFLTVPGEAQDLSGTPGIGQSRLSFGSDLFYDKAADEYYGITDRGPGGGVQEYAPRVNVFKVDVDASTGAVSNFQQQRTIVFKSPDGTPLSGLMPDLLPGGTKSALGKSFDSEGFVRRANGNFLVSDEYGPSIYEFKPDGSFVRAFAVPANLVPRQADGTVNYVDGRNPTLPALPIVTGRQDNRGFEGLTLSRDGKTAYAVLQDPLVNEGDQSDGRRSRNVRIVVYDVATGASTSQLIYQLEDRADINARLNAVGGGTFNATSQGRNIGLSAIYALRDGKFLVIERDNRGLGVDDPNQTNIIGSKRVYLIDINGATDVSGISLAGTSTLPGNVVPVTKTLFLDVDAALKAAGITVAEKLEGLTIGRDLNGGVSLLLASDNDFSTTQTGPGMQNDVCIGGGLPSTQVAFGSPCTNGQTLIPTYLYSFKLTGADAQAVAVPEPATWAMMLGGFGLVGAAMRRRQRSASATA